MLWSNLNPFRKGNVHDMQTGKGGVSHSRVSVPIPDVVFLRQGKWVVVGEGKVGIVNDMTDLRRVGVMLVDAKGENLLQTYFPFGDLTVARLEQIPLPRRPERDNARRLGYF